MKKSYFLPLLFLVLLCGSCKETGYGSLTINLKDSPGDYEEINIDLEKIEIYVEAAKKSGWYSLHTNKGIYNILQFQNTSVLVASHSELPEGKISLIKLVLGNNNSLKENNKSYALSTAHLPGEKFNVLIQAECIIASHGILNMLLDIDAERSVIKTGTHQYRLSPVAISAAVNSPMDIY